MTQQELLALLASAATPAAPAAQPGTPISGPIVGLASGAKIGDCRVRTVPTGVKWVKKTGKDGRPYVRSATICSAIARIGEHGGAWATDVTDSGVPYVENASVSTFDLEGALKAADGAPADDAAAPADAPMV